MDLLLVGGRIRLSSVVDLRVSSITCFGVRVSEGVNFFSDSCELTLRGASRALRFIRN